MKTQAEQSLPGLDCPLKMCRVHEMHVTAEVKSQWAPTKVWKGIWEK